MAQQTYKGFAPVTPTVGLKPARNGEAVKKDFVKEGSFWWNVGVFFLLIGLLMMFTKDELQDMKEGFSFLSDILPNTAST